MITTLKTVLATCRRSVLLAALAVMALAAAAAPAAAQNVAVVNIRLVAEKHYIYVQWKQDTDAMREERQQIIDQRIKEEFDLPDDDEDVELTEEQQLAIQQYLYVENQRFLEDMEPIREQKLLEVETDILEKVEGIAASRGYDLVLDSSVVLVGGTDITDDVIVAVNADAPAE